MATNTPISNVFEKNQYNLTDAAKKSRAWFEQQALLMMRQQITPNKILKSEPDHLKATLLPGKMYMFLYDPKYKETLPYYDRFPLVLPFRKVQGGFFGLNLHYLPYQLRIKLLDRLMIYASNKKMDETTRLKYSWAMIDGVSKFKAAEPCVKHYLSEHLRSQFRLITADQWATAALLPVERFVGSSKQAIWAESSKRAR